MDSTTDKVKEYYGKTLESSDDLKTSACCVGEDIPLHVKDVLKDIHDEVMEKFYGCGSPIPSILNGKTVLDLGSGSGRDCFVFSKLVGAEGRVIGVDMTEEQVAVANKYVDYHTEKFGFSTSNVEFKKGYIEDLKSLGIADNSVDVVVSNCVINLSADKKKVFKEIFRVLKPGGELHFSDVFSGRRIPQELMKDPVLLGECLSGAMYFEDFRRMLVELGINDYRVVKNRRMSIDDKQVYKKIGMVDFYSTTIRAFKLNLEDRCEDFGQVAYYNGGVTESPHEFYLDDHHSFKQGMPYPVCSNTADMLIKSRFSQVFKVVGDAETHYGLFDCDPSAAIVSEESETDAIGGCC